MEPDKPVTQEPKTCEQVIQEQAECIEAQGFVLKTLSDLFREFGVAANASSSDECMQSLRNRLSDAAGIYSVMRGERKASELLGEMERIIPAETFTAIVVDLSTFLAPRLQKFVTQLQDAGPDHQAAIAAAMLATGMKGWEGQRPIFERRMFTVQQLQHKCRQLCESAGIGDENDQQAIEREISAAIGADALALSQVEAGDFSEVERLFAERGQRQHLIQ